MSGSSLDHAASKQARACSNVLRFQRGSGPGRGRAETRMTRPLIGADGHPGEHSDPADLNVAEIDVPGLLVLIVATTAGEGGHGGKYSL